MRTKADITEMQCRRCGQIQEFLSDLYNCDLVCKYEDLPVCYQCYETLKELSEVLKPTNLNKNGRFNKNG